MLTSRVKEVVGLMMIGEGVVAALRPEEYARFWSGGPSWWQRMLEPFLRHPNWTRAIGAAEAVAGYWLAMRQLPEAAA